MARGRTYDDEIKAKAIVMLEADSNLDKAARELGVPRSTLRSWKDSHDKKAVENGEETIAEIRQRKKEEFARKAWRTIDTAMQIAERRLQRELTAEGAIDELCEKITKDPTIVEDPELLRDALAKINSTKITKISELSTLIGTLFDKYSLANKDPTVNIGGEIDVNVKKFEDL